MALKVQRRASGLLSSLGVVGQGNTPNSLAELVSPTIDVQLFFDAGRHEIVEEIANVTAVGDNVTISVPASEAWRIVSVSARYVASVGANPAPSFWVGCRFKSNGNNTILGYHTETTVNVAANEEAAAVGILPSPIILGPGAQIRAQLATAAPAASVLIVLAAIARYRS